jgi:hypothetical protein
MMRWLPYLAWVAKKMSLSMARARDDDVPGGAVERHEVIGEADGVISRAGVVGWQIMTRCRVLVQGQRGERRLVHLILAYGPWRIPDSLEIFWDSKGG